MTPLRHLGKTRLTPNVGVFFYTFADIPRCIEFQSTVLNGNISIPYITMQVIASVEKYENAGMKFSTVPAFALAESRASDACCLSLVQTHTHAKSACVPPQESSDQVAHAGSDWINCTRGERTASTHELRPVPFPCATCRPPPMQPCCDACIVSPC